MAYALESNLRPEVRRSTATTVVWWPKVDGTGNATASATGGHNYFIVYDPAGVEVQAQTNVSPTTVTGVGSRFDLSVPSISTMGEDYRIDLFWRVSGETLERLESIYFDVVREPWGPSTVSLNSLQSLVPDIGDRLTRQANRLSQTVEQRASSVAHQARVELTQWLRQSTSEDVARLHGVLSTTRAEPTQYDAYLRPRLIKDKVRLHNIEVKLALALAFQADMRADLEEPDGVAALYEHWLREAKSSYTALGPLKYDTNDDGTAETTVSEVGRWIPHRRVQS